MASYIALALCVAEVLLILMSWLLSVSLADGSVRSLLSSEGVRWFFGSYVDILLRQQLIWILLLSLSWGVYKGSGMGAIFRSAHRLQYRERIALWLVAFIAALIVTVLLLLTAIPHAVLLSVTGALFPSPFSESIFPVLAFSLFSTSAVFGIVSGTFQHIDNVYQSMKQGVNSFAPLFLFYVLITQLLSSFIFVFG